MYGVSVYSIAAANKDIIVDIDLVFKGQLLNIPPPNLLRTQLVSNTILFKLFTNYDNLDYHICCYVGY